MSLDIRTAYSEQTGYGASSRPPFTETIRLRANWGERIVTVLAASIAILVVAVVAVLMGMA
jgi:hypothetical protein